MGVFTTATLPSGALQQVVWLELATNPNEFTAQIQQGASIHD
ncbi:hypothetical protein Mic7113_3763 [Allocoleopsis franciscana PCC 7113]|uniref:Uncharacterized protein n=1 Tax=Allocoleopsis franciscana PCC 7113 TaxID=1173027 RepID=K9WI44_9CYAN|nr:hypothetical protein Mic7113_3763 [Allocoleopsis franciscana PCC 7113]